ncbi:MAG: alkaline phosphatase family protein [Gemmatimonadetes bacterium]|nr:alkaline phosphatase family protein [Gemmatimonadota bacterium]
MKKVLIGAVVLIALAGVIFALSKGIRPGDVAELIASGGTKQLNEPMRAPRGTTHVLIFALDGVGVDELHAAVAGGRAPHIASILGADQGDGVFATAYSVPDVLTVLPSTTLAAWASVFTGEPPARTGIPGNEFFVREERRYYAPAPVTIADATHVLSTYSDDLMGGVLAVPTLYERAGVRSYVSLSHIHRGADMLVVPAAGAMGDIALALVAGIGEDDGEVESDEYGELDTAAVEILLETMQEYGPADLQVVYFPGVDLYTHIAHDPIADQRDYVRTIIDPAVGDVLSAYRNAGILDRTYIIFISDHGHTPVIDDDRHALEAEGDDEPTAVIEQAGFRMRPLSLDVDEDDDFQATVAYQGAFAYVYLADRSTCEQEGTPCDWMRAPRLQEDVLPLVRAFDNANRTGALVPAMRGTLDLIFAREPRPTSQDALPFEVWDGEALVSVEEYLAANPRPDLVALAERLHGLGAGPHGHRAGDVLLLARSGGSRPIEDRFYFSGRYRSWHGSPDEQDSRIPLIVARSGSSGGAIRDLVRPVVGDSPSQLGLVPLIEALLAQP